MLINHVMVTKQNVCEYYPDQTCSQEAGMDYTFPQAEFEAHLAALKDDPALQDVQNLIPSN